MAAHPDRRDFLAQAGSCAWHLSLAAALVPSWRLADWTARQGGRVVATEPFGRLEEIGSGVWALISTPLNGDRTTLCNGGIVAGRSGVAVFEGFFQPAGATWLATKARELTGKWPTHAVVSHYHSDHSNGVAGFGEGGAMPRLHATAGTVELVGARNGADAARARAYADTVLIAPNGTGSIDLGGRTLSVFPKAGHTSSDVAVLVSEPRILFGGDLIWNGMFPNYMDCTPTLLARTVRELMALESTSTVPGHGPVGRGPEVTRYLSMLEEVERAARAAHGRGQTAAEGAAGYTLPASLGEWILFNPRFMETAFTAWYRELNG